MSFSIDVFHYGVTVQSCKKIRFFCQNFRDVFSVAKNDKSRETERDYQREREKEKIKWEEREREETQSTQSSTSVTSAQSLHSEIHLC